MHRLIFRAAKHEGPPHIMLKMVDDLTTQTLIGTVSHSAYYDRALTPDEVRQVLANADDPTAWPPGAVLRDGVRIDEQG